MIPTRRLAALGCVILGAFLLQACAGASPRATDWRGVTFQQFLALRTDPAQQELAAQHLATGARAMSYTVDPDIYTNPGHNPVDRMIGEFRAWCGQNGGVFAPDSKSGPFGRAMVALNRESRHGAVPYTGYECRGPNPVGLVRFDMNGRVHQLGAVQNSALLLYATAEWTTFLDHYADKEVQRRYAAGQAVYAAEQKRMDRTRALRGNPKIGDRTTLGLIVDVRPPLALIQFNESIRQFLGKPQVEWVHIDSLEAP